MADDAPRPITHADLRGLAGLQRRAADAIVAAQPRTVREATRLPGVGRPLAGKLRDAGLLTDPDGWIGRAPTTPAAWRADRARRDEETTIRARLRPGTCREGE